MIALCVLHHGQADADAFTIDQLRAFKDPERNRSSSRLAGRFHWKRERLILLAGGNWWTGCEILLRCGPIPIIWLSRDEDGYELLNLDLYDASGVARLRLRDNDWIVDREVEDLECTPRKPSLIVKTAMLGAELSISFERARPESVTRRAVEIAKAAERDTPQWVRDQEARQPEWVREEIRRSKPSPEETGASTAQFILDGIPEPDSALCVIEGQLHWPIQVALEPTRIVLPGNNILTGNAAKGGQVGIQIN